MLLPVSPSLPEPFALSIVWLVISITPFALLERRERLISDPHQHRLAKIVLLELLLSRCE
jgi:hypothetical protein